MADIIDRCPECQCLNDCHTKKCRIGYLLIKLANPTNQKQNCNHNSSFSSSPNGSFQPFNNGWEIGGFCWCTQCGAIRIGGTKTWIRPGKQDDVYADIKCMNTELVTQIPVNHPAITFPK
jgi:hypothetical protein